MSRRDYLICAGRSELPLADAECRVLGALAHEPRAGQSSTGGGSRPGKRRRARRVGLAPSEPLPLREDSRPWMATKEACDKLRLYVDRGISLGAYMRLRSGSADIEDAERGMELLYPLGRELPSHELFEPYKSNCHVIHVPLGLR